MERINPFSFMTFGKEMQAVLDLPANCSAPAAMWPIWAAKMAIERLLNNDPIPVGISASKAKDLLTRMTALTDAHFHSRDEKTGNLTFRFPDQSDPPIPVWQLDYVKSGFKDFETVFAEEMRETATYFVPRRGIYFTPALVDDADQTFPRELTPYISAKTRSDWKAAGRCLAFSLLSASGFHVARAVEACLEDYYGLFSGKPGQTLHGWMDYIKALRAIAEKNPTPSPSSKTLAELDQMREDYRNPIIHPRVVLTESDARMLFANGESLIIAMAQEMAAAATGVQEPLALEGGSSPPAVDQL